MSLFAPKCDRCGKKTRNEEEGKPVCDACVNEMALILDATKENARHCPVDDSVMQKEVAHMVLIDRCPSCHGVWLDGGELDKLRDDLQADAMLAMTRSFTMGMS